MNPFNRDPFLPCYDFDALENEPDPIPAAQCQPNPFHVIGTIPDDWTKAYFTPQKLIEECFNPAPAPKPIMKLNEDGYERIDWPATRACYSPEVIREMVTGPKSLRELLQQASRDSQNSIIFGAKK